MNENKQFILDAKPHIEQNLHQLLIPFLKFRAYVKFKSLNQYSKHNTCHFYAQEQRCTYNQCLHFHVPYIELDRVAGYERLVDLIERRYKGKYLSADIYGRVPGENKFDIIHRRYLKGKLDKETVNDPVIDISDVKKLIYYTVERGRLVLSETPFNVI